MIRWKDTQRRQAQCSCDTIAGGGGGCVWLGAGRINMCVRAEGAKGTWCRASNTVEKIWMSHAMGSTGGED